MRVLDIDLDFFLADCCPLADPGKRPELFGHEPWKPEQVSDFLKNNCGLSENNPIPGAVFTTHDQALSFWKDRIAENRLTVPFRVTHIDAHSDLGIGKPGPGFVLNMVLGQLPQNRPDLAHWYEMRQLDEANYLLFALAFRWISELDNVRNPRSRQDIPPEILLPGQPDRIRLRSFVSSLLESRNGAEPEIPFHVFTDYTTFWADTSFDYMTVAVSPRYAPKEADALLPVFQSFLLS